MCHMDLQVEGLSWIRQCRPVRQQLEGIAIHLPAQSSPLKDIYKRGHAEYSGRTMDAGVWM